MKATKTLMSSALLILAVECHAETLVLSPVQAHSVGCVLQDDGARPDPMNSTCEARFAIQLPVGKVIDGIEVGYWYDAINVLPPGVDHISAGIVRNAYKTHLNPDLSSTFSFAPLSPQQEYFLQVHPTNGSFPIDYWTTYDVVVDLTVGIRVDGISVLYH